MIKIFKNKNVLIFLFLFRALFATASPAYRGIFLSKTVLSQEEAFGATIKIIFLLSTNINSYSLDSILVGIK